MIRFWRKILDKKNESGFATAALFMLMMPVSVAMIGFSFDFARIAYIKTGLEGNANLAVQSAANIGFAENGRIVLGKPGQRDYSERLAKTIYCENTNISGSCDSRVRTFTVGRPVSIADLCSPIGGGNTYGVRLIATETYDTVFMGLIGVPTFTLEIDSTALVRPRSC